MNSTGIRLLGVSLLAAVAVSSVAAQAEPRLRLGLEDPPRVGHEAPAIRLPYATASGPGPAEQPFELGKELGNVVVIAFYPGDFTPGCTAEWRAFRDRAATLFGSGVVVVGISKDPLASHQRFAQELELPFKLLSDPDLQVARRYAAVDGPRARRVVVVVGRDGRVRSVDLAFAPLDPESYVHLATAVAAAKERK